MGKDKTATDEYTVVVIGGGGVGKSCLTVRYLKDEFLAEYDPTIEENYRKKVTIPDTGSECILDVVDTAGQEEYSSLRDQHLRTGQGFLLVYAINDSASFDEVKELHGAVTMVKEGMDKIPFIVVGNKCDLPEADRQVDKSAGQAFADQIKAPFVETSALENINVEECFHTLVKECQTILSSGSQPKDKKKKKTLFGGKK